MSVSADRLAFLKAKLGKPATPEELRDRVLSLSLDYSAPESAAMLLILKMIKPDAWAKAHAILNKPDEP